MKRLTIDDVKAIQCELLVTLSVFCAKKSIKYYLGYGTLLGAARHGGYIPWDDDIDVLIPRPYYEELLKCFNGEHENCKIISCRNDPDFLWPYAKLCCGSTVLVEGSAISSSRLGVNIDLFPIDGYVPSYVGLSWLRIKIIECLRAALMAKYIKIRRSRMFGRNLLLLIGKVISFAFPYRLLVAAIDRLSRINFYDDSELVGCLVWNYSPNKEIVPKRVFGEAGCLRFEKRDYPVPILYKEFLTKLYGNYMVLPPDHKRVAHHAFEAFRMDREGEANG